MTNEHVVRVVADGKEYSVLARRELTANDVPCCNCGGVAAGVKLVAAEVYHKTGRITDDAIRHAVEEAMKEHPFARSVCGSPRCYGTFLGGINASGEMYRRLDVA